MLQILKPYLNGCLLLSTEKCICLTLHELYKGDNYSVIISDIGRPPDDQAGYMLLEEIRKRAITIPFIIYAGSRAPEYVAKTCRRGGLGTTNRPIELFEMVVDAIKAG